MVKKIGTQVLFFFLVVNMLLVARATTAIVQTKAESIDYDIVYVRQPRYGDTVNTVWPEVTQPGRAEPGADLMLLRPDGSEEVLVAGSVGSVTDPILSFDAQWIYYSYFYDLRPESLNIQRDRLSYEGADIFRINVDTREIEQLTFGEFTPNTAAGVWDESNPLDPGDGFNRLGFGILNTGPCPLPDGRIMFTSSRNAFDPPRGFSSPTLQLYVMDENGDNVTQVGHMNLGSALHPTVLQDGRVIFSTLETQGLRGELLWGIWSIFPDGRNWEPVVSAFTPTQAFHFVTQMPNEDIVVTDYYNANNNGFGALYRLPKDPPNGQPRFNDAYPQNNDQILHSTEVNGAPYTRPIQIAFSPRGMISLTPFTTGSDFDAPTGANGQKVGKFTHPSAAPNGDLLTVWTPGPANHRNGVHIPAYDGGLYIIPEGEVVDGPEQLQLIKNDPAYNEAWPRALVSYEDIHGIAQPAVIPWLPNDGSAHPELPEGTPHALIGASSLYKRETTPGTVVSWLNNFDGLDPFNTSQNNVSSNWVWQGADAGKYDNSDIWAIRIIAMEPNTFRSYGPQDLFQPQFRSFARERLRILGEIPVRKFDEQGAPILDPDGNPDTSFLAKIPADTPFTFQTIDRNAMVLNMSQTWHQLRPGEVRHDCGGCHAHSQAPLEFEQTAAAQANYTIYDLNKVTPLITHDATGQPELDIHPVPVVNVEFYRDIRPLLEASCTTCHTDTDTPPGNLVLDDHSVYGLSQYPTFNVPGDYARLAFDENAQWGYSPVVSVGRWRHNNASRYIRKFQSRRSMLMWKLFGQRLDGWSNADHPTETAPGDANTLNGANPDHADLDYTGTMMPPPGFGLDLTVDERMTFARWIDLGAPIEIDSTYGWFFDDLRPTLSVTKPPTAMMTPLTEVVFGAADAYSGIDPASLTVTANFDIADRAPGTELADLVSANNDGIFTLALTNPVNILDDGVLNIEIADQQGNVTRVQHSFSVNSDDADGDGVPSPTDNCQTVFNPSQIDSDNDGYGNRCDADLNNDCVVNFLDLNIFSSIFLTVFADADFNGDGLVNFLDLNIMSGLFFAPPGPSATGTCSASAINMNSGTN